MTLVDKYQKSRLSIKLLNKLNFNPNIRKQHKTLKHQDDFIILN